MSGRVQPGSEAALARATVSWPGGTSFETVEPVDTRPAWNAIRATRDRAVTPGRGATFTWLQGDTAAGSVAKDYVVDFSKAEGDKLDLSDLLDHDGSRNQNDLKSLLSVFQDSEGVHLHVKESSAAPVTQEIVLMNHTFDTLTGGSGTTANQVIDFMLQNNMLDINK